MSEPPRAPATPYVGLVPYREEDADFYFGRDRDIRIVTGNLRASRLTILYGSSGVGKTSLLEAGVVHDLHEQALANAAAGHERAPFAVCSFRAWRDDPLPALVETIRGAAVEALSGEELRALQPGRPLVETLRSWTERVRTLLVVLDQFEDYFLYHPDEDGEGTFAIELPRIVNEPSLRVNFLLSIREDAWAKLDRFEGRIPHLFANYIRVEHLSSDAAGAAIRGPVDEWNRRRAAGELRYTVEDTLVEAVVEAAAAGELAGGEGGEAVLPNANGGTIEAPFIQLVMERLWRATVAAGSHDLSLARLQELGGAQRIVDNHLRDALGALTRSEQGVAADAFRYLVTRSRTKVAHSASDLAEWTRRPEPEVSAVLDKLCRSDGGRLLRAVHPAGENEATRYELFHDVLAEPMLEWRRGHEQRSTRRRFAGVGGGLLALVAVFAALGLWALVQRNDARRATNSATSLVLAETASRELGQNVEDAVLLALEAYRASPSVEARSSMISALEVTRSFGVEAVLRGDGASVRSVAFSPDGDRLASGGADGTVRLWDLRAGESLGKPLRNREGAAHAVVFSPVDGDTLAAAYADGTVLLWDVPTGKKLGRLRPRGHPLRVSGVAFSPDGRTLATAYDDGRVLLWDTRTRRRLGRALPNTSPAVAVAFTSGGRTLAAAYGNATVVLWDVRAQRPVGPTQRVERGGIDGAFGPDGRMLAARHGETVQVWDTRTRRPSGGVSRLGVGPLGFALSPTGGTLATADNHGVRLWDVPTGEALGQLPRAARQGSVSSLAPEHTTVVVAFSQDGRTLASTAGSTVLLWDLGARRPLGRPLRGQEVRIAFSPDGRTLASADYDHGFVRLWDVRERKPVGKLVQVGRKALSVAFSPKGRTLAAAYDDGSVLFWDVRSRTPSGPPLRIGRSAVYSVAFSPDGRTLATADHSVRLWDVRARRPLGKELRHGELMTYAVFSPDGRTLAGADETGRVQLWDARTGEPLGRPLCCHADAVEAVAFSPDGKTLASAGGYDGTVHLWNVRSRTSIGELPVGSRVVRVMDVAFGPDGRTLAVAYGNGRVRLWDVPTIRLLGKPLRGHRGAVSGVAFSPDGRTLASAGTDGTLRLWEGVLWRDFADLRAQVCRLVVGSLTRSRWSELVPGVPYRTTCPS